MTMNFNEFLLHRATQPNCAGPFWEILDLANKEQAVQEQEGLRR